MCLAFDVLLSLRLHTTWLESFFVDHDELIGAMVDVELFRSNVRDLTTRDSASWSRIV